LIPNGWSIRQLGDLTENHDASRIPVKEADRRLGPYPYYGASGIVDHVDGYLFDGEYLLIAEDGENLRTRQTPIAFVARGKFWVNNHAHIVRGNALANTRFLMYALTATEVSGYLTGSTMPKLTQGNMNRIPILTPPVDEQQAMVAMLGALDDKIELNRRMNETLEAIARTIFKSWFVDFDPVRAKAEGCEPVGVSAGLAALFPNCLHDGIPTGWSAGTFGHVACNKRVQVKPGGVANDTPYIGLEHMPRKSIALTEWGRADEVASNKFVFAINDILFGKLRPYFHKVGVAAVDGVCSTDILVLTPKDPQRFGFVLGHASSDEMIAYSDAGSTGTKMPRTSWADLSRYDIVIPQTTVARKFNELVVPVVDRIRSNIHESRTLAAVRDTLLPKLLSGEIRVKQAEKVVEAASM